MKRPLFAAGLALAAFLAVRLGQIGLSGPPDQCGMRQFGQFVLEEPVVLTGTVCQKDQKSFSLKSVVLYQENQMAAISQQKIPYQKKIICRMETAEEIVLGSTVTVRGELVPFSAASNPGEFDSISYYRSIMTCGRLLEAEVLTQKLPRFQFHENLYKIRCFWEKRLYLVFPEKEAALMSALLLGERSGLDEEIKNLYKRNGILHILSISSMHITIMGMGLHKLLRRVGVPLKSAAVAAGLTMVLYGVMTGGSVSVCRAVGMFLLHMLAEVTGRTYDMLTALGVVGSCMLLWNPWYLQNSGFLLSFSSVLGIGVAYPALSGMREESPGQVRYGERRIKKMLRIWKNKLRENFLLSLSISLATLPVQLAFFYEIPGFGIFINFLVLPLVKPLLMIGAVSLILPFGAVPGTVACIILRWYESLCRFFDMLPFGSWNPGKPQGWQLAAYYALFVLALLWAERSRRRGGKAEGDERGRRREKKK